MPASVALLVLLAAAFHATWNAILRVQGDRFVTVTLMAAASGLAVLPLLPFFPAPAAAAWPWLFLSIVLHVGYNVFLASAYRAGDLSRVYPLARGSAPLLTLILSAAWFGETASPAATLGVLLITGGILLLAFERGLATLRRSPAAVGFALLTALFISGYTLSDGHGARLAGSADGYTLWLFALDGLPLIGFALLTRRRALLAALPASGRQAALAGVLSLASYWIVIAAFAVAPIPLVAALRETSVVFAMLIGILILREPVTVARLLAPMIVIGGLALTRV